MSNKTPRATKKPRRQAKLNVDLLRRVQKHILEEPRRFLMDAYALRANSQHEWEDNLAYYNDVSPIMPPCGTAACIAGTALLLTGHKVLNNAGRAHDILKLPFGFDEFDEHPVFIVTAWPAPYRGRYRNAVTPKGRAKIACARIDHLIKTGK